MSDTTQPAIVPADDGYTRAAVLVNFDMGKQIGELRILTSALPPTPNFVFSLGFEAMEYAGKPGDVPSEPPACTKYRLMAVAPVLDTEYVGYLRQTGVITDQADTADLRKANFLEAIGCLRHLQASGRFADCKFVVDECADELRAKAALPAPAPITLYAQARLNRTILEEANEIMQIPGMIVDTPAWRRIMGAIVTIVEKFHLIETSAPADPNNGWLRFVPGETKLVVDREYWVLWEMNPPPHGTDHFQPAIARFQESRMAIGGKEFGPGFVEYCDSIGHNYAWYQEIRFPPPQAAKESA